MLISAAELKKFELTNKLVELNDVIIFDDNENMKLPTFLVLNDL